MVSIRAVINYIVANGVERVEESKVSHILDLGNGYSIEYIIPIRMCYYEGITIRKRGFIQEFKGDAIDYLDAHLKKENNIYEVIDFYESESIKKESNRQLELEEVKKFMGRRE